MIPKNQFTLVASGARAADGDSGPLEDLEDAQRLRIQLDVTAASGTGPTLDVVVEDSLDGTNWNAIGTFAQKTAADREVVDIAPPFGRRVRVRWTIAGTTPSFTFSVIAVVS